MNEDYLITVFCPNCGSSIRTEIMRGKKSVVCSECGYEFAITHSNLNEYIMSPSNATERQQFEDALDDYRLRKGMGFPERRRGRRAGSGSSGWNGFSDPDDFPSDGYDGGGW